MSYLIVSVSFPYQLCIFYSHVWNRTIFADVFAEEDYIFIVVFGKCLVVSDGLSEYRVANVILFGM